MAAVVELECVDGKISSYLTLIDSLQPSLGGPPWWFRGEARDTHALLPRCFRTNPTVHLNKEKEVLDFFKMRSAPYLNDPPATDWDFLVIMQHYGVPTRLLDWSENALYALYFAVATHLVDKATGPYAVWVINPIRWNDQITPYETKRILTESDEELKGHAPPRPTNTVAMAMYSTFNNPRISAQKGIFTAFGNEAKSLEDQHSENAKMISPCLAKIKFPASTAKDTLASLSRLGVTETSIYPDLDGLAREIRARYF